MKPYENLAYAILQQAVEDYQMMKTSGIILPDGSVISNSEWPKIINKKGDIINKNYCGINKPHEVIEMIAWLSTKDAGRITVSQILSECGSKLTQADICKGLGLKMIGAK